MKKKGNNSAGAGGSVRATERQKILRALDGLLETAEELLEVIVSFDEIDFGSVDDQEIGAFVAEKEMFVGPGDFLDIFRGDATFLARFLLGDARAKHVRLGLKIDDEIGLRKLDSESLVIAFVEFQFGVIEIEVGKNAVFLHQEIGDDGARGVAGKGFADASLAFHQEIELSVKGCAKFSGIEIGEKGVVLAVKDAARVKAFGKDPSERGFSDAQRAFDDDEARRLRPGLRLPGTFRRRRFKGCHFASANNEMSYRAAL